MSKSKTYSIEKALKRVQKGKTLKPGYSIQVGSSYDAGTLSVASAQSTVSQWLSILNGAANKTLLLPGQLEFKLVDTFALIASNQGLISPYTTGPGYEFTNPPGSLGPVTVTQGLIIENALNGELYQPITYTSATFTLTSSTETLTNGGSVIFTLSAPGVPAGSEFAYVLSGLSASLIEGGQLEGFATMGDNGVAVVSVTLVDTLPFTDIETLTITFPNIGKTDSVQVSNTTVPFFTINADTLFGAGTATVFNAPLQPNGLGQESNTLQGTDRATGAEGVTNSLVATLIPQVTNGTGLTSSVVAIDPDTNNIENVFFTATGGVGFGGFFLGEDPAVLVDAYRNASWNMDDVEQWWSVQSDNDLIIRDATLNTSVGMDSTARFVDYTVLFRGDQLNAAPGLDSVNVVLNNVGQSEQGGDLQIGSTTPSSGNIGRRGIETFNVLMGNTSSFLDSLTTTGNRLTTVNVESAPAGLGAPGAPIGTADADTVLEIDQAFVDLSTFDAEGFIGQIGSLQSRAGEDGLPTDVRMRFNYNTLHAPGSTLAGIANPTINILGGDGGNTLGVYIGDDTGINLTFNGGASTDDMEIEALNGEDGGSNSISVNTGNGANTLRIQDQNTGALSAVGGLNFDDFDFDDINASSISVGLGDGANFFTGEDLSAAEAFSLVAGSGPDDVDITRLTAADVSIDVADGATDIDLSFVTANGGNILITAGTGIKDFTGTSLATPFGAFILNFGSGQADIAISNSSFASNTNITVNDDTPGNNNTITLTNISSSSAANNLNIITGAANDNTQISGSNFTFTTTINLGDGNNILGVFNTTFGSNTTNNNFTDVDTGTGRDQVTFSGVTALGPVTIDTQAGLDDVSFIGGDYDNSIVPAASVTVNTGDDADTASFTGGIYASLIINTGENDAASDAVTVTGITATNVNILTGDGDDQATYRNNSGTADFNVLNIDMGGNYDIFFTDMDLGVDGLSTPILFTNIEKLVLLRDAGNPSQAVDMAVLNARSGTGGIVQDIWVSPELGDGATTVDNVAADRGQNVTITNQSLPQVFTLLPWTTIQGFVGDVFISTLIDDEADTRTLDITLDASGNSPLGGPSVTAVNELTITDNSIGVASIERVVLTSTSLEGQLNSRNVVQFFDAYDDVDVEGIELLRIEGDRDLALHLGGEDGSIGLLSSDGTVDVRAETLEGDLQLVLDGTFLSESVTNSLIAANARADRLTSNGDFTNLLALYGEDINVNTIDEEEFLADDPANSSYINGFDTIQFGTDATGVMSTTTGLGLLAEFGVSGTFDAAGMTPGITYDIVHTIGDLTLDNLASTVRINTSLAGADDSIFLSDREGDSDEVLNLELYANSGVKPDWTIPVTDLNVTGFETVNIDLSAIASLSPNLGFDLFLNEAARTLVFTSDGIAAGSLDIDDGDAPLPTTLQTIDVSNYEGSFTGAFNNDQNDQKDIGDSDVFFVIGDNNFNFTLTDYDQDPGDGDGTTAANFNSVFSFAGDNVRTGTYAWSITNFIASGLDLANINNWSKIDFRAIGLTEDIGVNIEVVNGGDDLLITAQNSDLPAGVPAYNFSITLEGLGVFGEGIVNDQNFIFA